MNVNRDSKVVLPFLGPNACHNMAIAFVITLGTLVNTFILYRNDK